MTFLSWQTKPLSELADMCLGKMLDQQKNKGEYYPYLANTNVHWGSFDLDDLREMRFETHEFDRYGLKAGDIVMCEGGEPGRCAIWKAQTSSMMIQKALHRIRVKEEVDSLFLYYLLLNKGTQGHFEGYFTGAAIKHLTGVNLAKIKVKIPPLPTQQKIARILSAYDDLIENNLKRIKLLEEMAQITYEEWFVRMKFPGHENTPMGAETGLPEGWETRQAQNELDIKIGRTPPRGELHWFTKDGHGVKWVSIKDMRQVSSYIFSTNEKITNDGVTKHRMNIAKAGTVLLSFKLSVGEVVISTDDMVTNEAIAHMNIRNESNLNNEYIFLFLKNFNFDSLGSTSSIGTAINSKIVKVIPLLVPSKETLDNFSVISKPVFRQIKNIQVQSKLLKEARDILLPRLMTGLINVDDIDLPTPELHQETA